eukprot:881864-Rhodomonas_salina.3
MEAVVGMYTFRTDIGYWSVQFSHCGKRLASASKDRTVRVTCRWDLPRRASRGLVPRDTVPGATDCGVGAGPGAAGGGQSANGAPGQTLMPYAMSAYAMSGAETVYGATSAYAMSGTEKAYGAPRIRCPSSPGATMIRGCCRAATTAR